jgi:hypothetical protein
VNEPVPQGAVVASLYHVKISGYSCPISFAKTKRADPEGPLSKVEMIMSSRLLRDDDTAGKRIMAD